MIIAMGSRLFVAVIGDLVRSRQLAARAAAHDALLDVLSEVNIAVPALQPLSPTVGDEFQGLYSHVNSALRATLLVRLAFADDHMDARFGIGYGWHETFAMRGDGQPLVDGSAWWNAREAIEIAKVNELKNSRTSRTWYVSSDGDEPHPLVRSLTNAYLLARDEVVTKLDGRARRLALGTLRGRTQVELASVEGITQSAVSRSLHRTGVLAVLEGSTLLESVNS